jgi:hypothetical protein
MGTLLMRIGTSVGQKQAGGKDGKDMVDSQAAALVTLALRAAIRCGGEERMEAQLDNMNAWNLLSDAAEYPTAVQLLARGMCQQRPEAMGGLFAFLGSFLGGNYEGQRLAAASALAEMVAHCSGNEQLLEGLVNSLLQALTDNGLRIMCLRGLANIVGCGADATNRYSQTVMDALLSAVDSPEEAVSLEAMTGLAKVTS